MATKHKPQRRRNPGEFARTTFERHYGELHRFLVRRLPQSHDANDVIQEIFLRILRVDRPELVRKPLAYVYGIAAHVVCEFRLRGQHDRVTFDSETVDQAAEHPEHVAPDEMLESLISVQQLERTLVHLSPTHKAVLLLHKRDGLSREEVAERLGLSTHTVKKYLCQAMSAIRANWDR